MGSNFKKEYTEMNSEELDEAFDNEMKLSELGFTTDHKLMSEMIKRVNPHYKPNKRNKRNSQQ